MRGRRGKIGSRISQAAVASLLAFLAATAGLAAVWRLWPRAARPVLATVLAERDTVQPRLLVSGDVEGGERTLISCELEDFAADEADPASGQRGSGGQTVLEVVEDGARVKKGDLLIRFDSSRYEDRARRLRIELERARAEERQAELEKGAAQAALAAYRDGEALQITESLQAELALTESDLLRARERLTWVEQMRAICYVSSDDLAAARNQVQRLEVESQKTATSLRNHRALTAPKKTRELEIDVENAADSLRFGADQRSSIEGRLKSVEEQIARCIIRAPHDGMAVLIDWWWRRDGVDHRVAPGTRVTQHEELLYLPAMDALEIEIPLHESLIRQVRQDLTVIVQLPAFPGRSFPGRISRVDLLPTEQWRAWIEYQGFVCRVKLDAPPPGLRPGMSAQVEILTGPRREAVLLPPSAVAYDEDGHSFCYVIGPSGHPVRRTLSLGEGDSARLAVAKGLAAGDRVVLDPADVHGWKSQDLHRIKGEPTAPALHPGLAVHFLEPARGLH
jgi:HlyD family secretion protein